MGKFFWLRGICYQHLARHAPVSGWCCGVSVEGSGERGLLHRRQTVLARTMMTAMAGKTRAGIGRSLNFNSRWASLNRSPVSYQAVVGGSGAVMGECRLVGLRSMGDPPAPPETRHLRLPAGDASPCLSGTIWPVVSPSRVHPAEDRASGEPKRGVSGGGGQCPVFRRNGQAKPGGAEPGRAPVQR